MSLSPEEVEFFRTGDASHLTPEPGPQVDDAVANSGLNADPTLSSPQDTGTVTEPVEKTPDPIAPAVDEGIQKMLRDSLADSQRQLGALQAKFDEMNKAPKPEETPAPDAEKDPLGHLLHQVNATNKAVMALQERIQEQEQQSSQLKQLQAFTERVQALKNEYVKTTPDFDAAYNHLRTARLEDLKLVGFTDEQARQQLLSEEFQVAQGAMQQGKNPADVFYAMAKRHGYSPKPVAPKDSAEHLSKIEQAAAASRAASLPRTPEPVDLTPNGLRQASEADLNRLVQDPKAWAKIAGKDADDIFPAR